MRDTGNNSYRDAHAAMSLILVFGLEFQKWAHGQSASEREHSTQQVERPRGSYRWQTRPCSFLRFEAAAHTHTLYHGCSVPCLSPTSRPYSSTTWQHIPPHASTHELLSNSARRSIHLQCTPSCAYPITHAPTTLCTHHDFPYNLVTQALLHVFAHASTHPRHLPTSPTMVCARITPPRSSSCTPVVSL